MKIQRTKNKACDNPTYEKQYYISMSGLSIEYLLHTDSAISKEYVIHMKAAIFNHRYVTYITTSGSTIDLRLE
jgi:hypothetical protein